MKEFITTLCNTLELVLGSISGYSVGVRHTRDGNINGFNPCTIVLNYYAGSYASDIIIIIIIIIIGAWGFS